MRYTSLLFLFLLANNSAPALEVDASKFGFTYQLAQGWKVLGNPDPRRRGLFAIEKDRKASIAALVINEYVLPLGDLHYAVLNGVPPVGSKFKITESSVFRTASKNTGIRTKISVTTKDGRRLRQSLYSFEIRAWTYLCVSCTAPADGSFDPTIESIMKTFRLNH
jgi:hypothetical protein